MIIILICPIAIILVGISARINGQQNPAVLIHIQECISGNRAACVDLTMPNKLISDRFPGNLLIQIIRCGVFLPDFF